MWFLRSLVFVIVFGLIGLPVLVPIANLFTHPHILTHWTFTDRILPLLFNTCSLILGTVIMAVPIGTLWAILLFRTNLPLHRVFLSLTLICLFLPLPLQITAWQAALQNNVWPLSTFWQPRPGQPWPQGLFPAIWVHSIVAIPWVTILVGQTLHQHNAEWEEESLLLLPAWRVLTTVTLRQARPGVVLACLWVTLQVFCDISVTDMFLVRTFGEEVYLRFSRGGTNSMAETVAKFTPYSLLFVGMLLYCCWRMRSQFPVFQAGQRRTFRFSLGLWRWLWLFIAVLFLWFLFGLPLQSLWWKSGLSGTPLQWSWSGWWDGLTTTFVLDGATVVSSLLLCLLCGFLAVTLALGICWTSHSTRGLRFVYFGLLVIAYSLPSPIIGFGLKEVILTLVDWFPQSFLAKVLYYRPSYVPILWAYLLKTLPLAVAILWPSYQNIPREWLESAQLEGASSFRIFRRVQLPLLIVPIVISILAVAALALNEVGVSIIAGTPGTETFTLLLFNRMHYGVSRDVSCLALVLLFVLLTFLAEIGLRFKGRPQESKLG